MTVDLKQLHFSLHIKKNFPCAQVDLKASSLADPHQPLFDCWCVPFS
jgi:hypothetical protein